MTEPILTDEDRELWEMWTETARTWARLPSFQVKLDKAKFTVDRAVMAKPNACIMWSGGKDSTAMAHLIRVEMGIDLPAASEKDDLDYPGEEDYVHRLAEAWGLRLEILRPPVSALGWLREHGRSYSADDDMHSRRSGLSQACFYDLVENYEARFDLSFLGLRSEESEHRNKNRATHGLIYERSSKHKAIKRHWVATPIADWRGREVMAYLASRDVEVLPVYQCVALMHREEPWRIRKSWWIPGMAASKGAVTWLQRYYPSLYRELCRLFPNASTLA